MAGLARGKERGRQVIQHMQAPTAQLSGRGGVDERTVSVGVQGALNQRRQIQGEQQQAWQSVVGMAKVEVL